MTERFGERVRRKRQECRLGLRDTARRASISATFLSRVETDAEKAVPSEEVIRKLADILDDDFDDDLDDDDFDDDRDEYRMRSGTM